MQMPLIKKNKKIIIKYKYFLNQRNINTIISCVQHNINIIPILYQLTKINIDILINKSLEYNNIFMVNLLNNYVTIETDVFIKYMKYACFYGYINIVKYLHKNIGLSKEDFQTFNNYAYYACIINGHHKIIKYLLEEVKINP